MNVWAWRLKVRTVKWQRVAQRSQRSSLVYRYRSLCGRRLVASINWQVMFFLRAARSANRVLPHVFNQCAAGGRQREPSAARRWVITGSRAHRQNAKRAPVQEGSACANRPPTPVRLRHVQLRRTIQPVVMFRFLAGRHALRLRVGRGPRMQMLRSSVV